MKIIPTLYTNEGKLLKNTINGFIQSTVTIPLSHEKQRCVWLVKKGDRVKEGDVIAVPSSSSHRYCAKLHSSVPGIVEDIISCSCPNGKEGDAVRIKLSGEFSYRGKNLVLENWKFLSSSTIIQKIADGGVINTFDISDPISLATQIENSKFAINRMLVVRLYDDDPQRITDSILAAKFFDEIVNGALITSFALDAKAIIFVTDSKFTYPKNIDDFPKYIRFVQKDITEYPAGFRGEIIHSIKKSIKEEPFSLVSSDSIFVDVSSMIAVNNAVCYNIPSIEQYVYVSGECLVATGIIKVCLGTSMRFLAEQCGSFIRSPSAIIVNGLMLGSSAGSLDSPVTKYVKSVSFLPSNLVPDQRQSPCVRCGKCRAVCPRKLSPDILYRHAAGGMKAAKEYIQSSRECTGCTLCNSVCPSRLPICQAVKLIKNHFGNKI